MGLELKQKANKDILKLQEVKVNIKNITPDTAKNKLSYLKNKIQVYYNGLELVSNTIVKAIVDFNGFMPKCMVVFDDIYSVMHDIGFPADNAKMTIVIPANHDGFNNIFMDFKIEKFEIGLQQSTTIKRLYIWGICNVENLLISEYKSYKNKSSYQVLEEISKNSGIGLMSNINSSSDIMNWINPAMNNYQFIEDTISKSWNGENGFMFGFVDQWYNLNFIDIEQQLAQDISEIQWFNSDILDNSVLGSSNKEIKAISPYLTNDPSHTNTNLFFTSEKILNQSTNISLNRGYMRNAHFYDIDGNWNNKAGSYKVYDLDTITTVGNNNNTIFLKGDPGSTDFYTKNNRAYYEDKIDTINMFPDFLWAKLQNKENIYDLQKILIEITLPIINFNIKKFEKIKLYFVNNNIGINNLKKNIKLNGEWLVISTSMHYNGSNIFQKVKLVKRELTIDEV